MFYHEQARAIASGNGPCLHPQLTALVDNPLFSDVWARPIGALPPAHLRRACDNGVTRDELAALITHVAFYAGFPAAISASAIAARTLTEAGTKD
jgi:4-carboxymuconolactone decarboxylase